MRDFIVEDYKEKRKSFKSRQEQSRQCHLAAPFVLDEISVTFRPPSGYYGQFGNNDSSYCCDMGQNDTIGKIELNPSFVLSSVETNCKNDIQ